MKFQNITFLIIFLLISIPKSYSQTQQPPKTSLTKVSKVTYKIIAPYSDKKDQAKAIYDWITQHIKNNVSSKKTISSDPHKVIQKRKTDQLGFSNLFHQMCQIAGIPSLQVKGYSKSDFMPYKYRTIRSFHFWNLIKVDSKWYAVDATFGSGDLKYRTNFIKTKIFKQPHFSQKIKFIRNPSEEYFCTIPDNLNETHIPNIPEFQLTLNPRPVNPLFEIDSTAHISPINYTEFIEKFHNTTLWKQKLIEGNKASEFNPKNHFDLALANYEYCDFHFQEGAADDIKTLNALKVKIDSSKILFKNHLLEINQTHKDYLVDFSEMNRNVSRINARLESFSNIIEAHSKWSDMNMERAGGFQTKVSEIETILQGWKNTGFGPKKPNQQDLNKLDQQIKDFTQQLNVFDDSLRRFESKSQINHNEIITLHSPPLVSPQLIYKSLGQSFYLNSEMKIRNFPQTRLRIAMLDSLMNILLENEKTISKANNKFKTTSNKLLQYVKKKEAITRKYQNIIRPWNFVDTDNEAFKLKIYEFEERLKNDYLTYQKDLNLVTSWYIDQRKSISFKKAILIALMEEQEKFNYVFPHFLSFIAIRENNYFSVELELAKMMVSKSSALQRSISRKIPTK